MPDFTGTTPSDEQALILKSLESGGAAAGPSQAELMEKLLSMQAEVDKRQAMADMQLPIHITPTTISLMTEAAMKAVQEAALRDGARKVALGTLSQTPEFRDLLDQFITATPEARVGLAQQLASLQEAAVEGIQKQQVIDAVNYASSHRLPIDPANMLMQGNDPWAQATADTLRHLQERPSLASASTQPAIFNQSQALDPVQAMNAALEAKQITVA